MRNPMYVFVDLMVFGLIFARGAAFRVFSCCWRNTEGWYHSSTSMPRNWI